MVPGDAPRQSVQRGHAQKASGGEHFACVGHADGRASGDAARGAEPDRYPGRTRSHHRRCRGGGRRLTSSASAHVSQAPRPDTDGVCAPRPRRPCPRRASRRHAGRRGERHPNRTGLGLPEPEPLRFVLPRRVRPVSARDAAALTCAAVGPTRRSAGAQAPRPLVAPSSPCWGARRTPGAGALLCNGPGYRSP
jgi:hypothetical protein